MKLKLFAHMSTLLIVVITVFVPGCSDGPTDVDTKAKVLCVNVTTGMSSNGGFTANGQFVIGSALAFGQAAPACARVDPGTKSFGFGTANDGGTALSGNALATLNSQIVATGGNYTMVATGSAASPQLYLIDNRFSASVGSTQAAVRFLNLAPGPNAVPNIFAVFNTWPPLTEA